MLWVLCRASKNVFSMCLWLHMSWIPTGSIVTNFMIKFETLRNVTIPKLISKYMSMY